MSCPFNVEKVETSPREEADYLFEKFYEETNVLKKKADLQAKLICNRYKAEDDDQSREWEMNLSEIDGEHVLYILGRKYNKWETIPLDLLIPLKQQDSHYKRVVNILNEGPGSSYWRFLFEGMMSRTIKIINPTDNTPRFVNIFMNMVDYSIEEGSYSFEVIMTDQTAKMTVANMAGLLTHDLRAFMRAGINLVEETNVIKLPWDSPEITREEFSRMNPEQLLQLYDKGVEQKNSISDVKEHLKEIFYESLKMCSLSREDFLPENIIRLHSLQTDSGEIQETVLVDQSLTSFLEHLRANLSHIRKNNNNNNNNSCEINFNIKSDVTIAVSKSRVMERLVLNLIKNAIEVDASEVFVTCRVTQVSGVLSLVVEVTDNGPGMNFAQLADFFQRPLPSKSPRRLLKTAANVEAKRGEGTIMAYLGWESEGGKATASVRADGKSGTTMTLSIPVTLFRKKPSNTRLNKAYLEAKSSPVSLLAQKKNKIRLLLDELKRTYPNSWKVLLLVDDGLVNLKMLKRTVVSVVLPFFDYSKRKDSPLNLIAPNKWQEVGLETSSIENFGFIFAANGDFAHNVVLTHYDELSAIITDDQMPGELQGVEFIEQVRELEIVINQNTNLSFDSPKKLRMALNTAGEGIDLQKQTFLTTLDSSYVLKGDKISLTLFLQSVILPIDNNIK